MTRPVAPGRLAVRKDSQGYWRIHSPIVLFGYAGDTHADGTYSYPFGRTTKLAWTAAVQEAHKDAKHNRDRLIANACAAEPTA